MIAFGALGACSSEEGAGTSTGGQANEFPAAAPAAAGGPALEVSADKTHAVQPGDEITVTVSVTDFELDSGAVGSPAAPGRGHYRVYLDDASGDDFLAAGAGATAKVTIPEEITDGSHDLRVKLYNNDETPFEPATEASVLLIVYRL